jgi:hypothetical protein
MFVSVEDLSLIEQLSAESCVQETASRTAGAVHDQDGITHYTVRIAYRCADRPVVDLEFRQDFTCLELEILYDEVSLNWSRISGKRRQGSDHNQAHHN